MIQLTDSFKSAALELLEAAPGHKLRLAVQGGGCSGFQYSFTFDQQAEDDLLVEEFVVVDPISSTYLEGVTLDYETSLLGSQFKVRNPTATATCGCGKSFNI